MKYWVTTPPLLRLAFPGGLLWQIPATPAPAVYLTFDDGPHPVATPFIMQELEKYNAKATFFCIGKNVLLYPDVYRRLIDKGHRVANHTHNHMNGAKASDAAYMANIAEAARHIDSNLFRPPYGRLRRSQATAIRQRYPGWKICMWSVLSGDFDMDLSPEKCLSNVLKHIRPGAIVLFHDSDKAWPRMSFALPHVLEHCKKRGWQINVLPA